jgi:hypothetical protein
LKNLKKNQATIHILGGNNGIPLWCFGFAACELERTFFFYQALRTEKNNENRKALSN